MLTSFLATFFYIANPEVTLREEPSTKSQIASSAYYGEEVKIDERGGEFVKIRTLVDNYQGFVKESDLLERESPYPKAPFLKVARQRIHLYHTNDTTYGPILSLPFESQLEILDELPEQNGRWIKVALLNGKEAYIQRGDVSFELKLLTKDEMVSFSKTFTGLPYTWGGRTSFGYDCSGFIQMLYRQMGVFLPRDAKDQVKWEGFFEIEEDKLMPGDLIYFGLDALRIRHVGMYLGNREFIHANRFQNKPYIVISDLSEDEYNGNGTYPFRVFKTSRN